MSDDILSIVYLLLVLALVLPGFIYMNKNKKTFLKNLFLWVVIIFTNVLVLYLIL